MGGVTVRWDDDPNAIDPVPRFWVRAVVAGEKTYEQARPHLGDDERLHVVASVSWLMRKHGFDGADLERMVRLIKRSGDPTRGATEWITLLIYGDDAFKAACDAEARR